jgi:hypothetical protein
VPALRLCNNGQSMTTDWTSSSPSSQLTWSSMEASLMSPVTHWPNASFR